MTPTEQIAEHLELVVADAQAKGVNVFAFVQGNGQGAVYVTDGIKSMLGAIRQCLDDVERADDETLRAFGGISYGL